MHTLLLGSAMLLLGCASTQSLETHTQTNAHVITWLCHVITWLCLGTVASNTHTQTNAHVITWLCHVITWLCLDTVASNTHTDKRTRYYLALSCYHLAVPPHSR